MCNGHSSVVSFTPGARVGPYEILEPLGTGGMGEVYRARDPRLDRTIALKVLRATGPNRPADLDRLLREATLASALNHPNIITIYETGTAGADSYVAMELVAGKTLRQLMSEGVTIERAEDIARQVAEALAVAHEAGIVHRDIKPENVMVRRDGYVKVLDFGVARVHADDHDTPTEARTDAGMVLGTVGYMAPEQVRGDVASPAADIFAFGVVLYELVTGRHPFATATALGMLHAVVTDTPEPASLVEELSRLQPVVLLFDDVHWADPSTIDLIGYLVPRLDGTRALVVATARESDLTQSRHPFLPLQLDLVARGLCRTLHPGPLDRSAIDRYLTLRFDVRRFPPSSWRSSSSAPRATRSS